MNTEMLNIETIDPVIAQYLIDKMTQKNKHKLEINRARANRWYLLHRKVYKDTIDENNNVVKNKLFLKNGRPRKVINVELEVIPLIII